MEYDVFGTIEMNFECTVEAKSEEHAEEQAKMMAAYGDIEYGNPVDVADITDVTEAKKCPKKE